MITSFLIGLFIILVVILYIAGLIIIDNVPIIKHPKYFTVIEIFKSDEEFSNDCFNRYNEIRAFRDAESYEPVNRTKQVMILN